MTIDVEFYGKTIVTIIVKSGDTVITEDVNCPDGVVDTDFIEQLADVVYQLECHNESL